MNRTLTRRTAGAKLEKVIKMRGFEKPEARSRRLFRYTILRVRIWSSEMTEKIGAGVGPVFLKNDTDLDFTNSV
jgi:hypothetical protein